MLELVLGGRRVEPGIVLPELVPDSLHLIREIFGIIANAFKQIAQSSFLAVNLVPINRLTGPVNHLAVGQLEVASGHLVNEINESRVCKLRVATSTKNLYHSLRRR